MKKKSSKHGRKATVRLWRATDLLELHEGLRKQEHAPSLRQPMFYTLGFLKLQVRKKTTNIRPLDYFIPEKLSFIFKKHLTIPKWLLSSRINPWLNEPLPSKGKLTHGTMGK